MTTLTDELATMVLDKEVNEHIKEMDEQIKAITPLRTVHGWINVILVMLAAIAVTYALTAG